MTFHRTQTDREKISSSLLSTTPLKRAGKGREFLQYHLEVWSLVWISLPAVPEKERGKRVLIWRMERKNGKSSTS